MVLLAQRLKKRLGKYKKIYWIEKHALPSFFV
jgi:hypothetical protein